MKEDSSRRTGRRRTECRRPENPRSRVMTIYCPQKDDSTNCDINLESSIKVDVLVNVTFKAF